MVALDRDPYAIDETFNCPASLPSHSTMNGRPCPARAFARSDRMLARVSNDPGAYGLVASHCRSQPRLSRSDRSSGRASRRRMGRNPTRPSLRVGTTMATDSSFSRPSAVPVTERLDGARRVGGPLLDVLVRRVRRQGRGEFAQPRPQLGAEVFAIGRQANDRLDVVEAV